MRRFANIAALGTVAAFGAIMQPFGADTTESILAEVMANLPPLPPRPPLPVQPAPVAPTTATPAPVTPTVIPSAVQTIAPRSTPIVGVPVTTPAQPPAVPPASAQDNTLTSLLTGLTAALANRPAPAPAPASTSASDLALLSLISAQSQPATAPAPSNDSALALMLASMNSPEATKQDSTAKTLLLSQLLSPSVAPSASLASPPAPNNQTLIFAVVGLGALAAVFVLSR